MAKNPIEQAIKQICEEKNISYESVLETIEAALAVAYRKDFGEKNQNIKVDFDPKTTSARVFDVKTVVSDEMYEKTMAWKEKKEKEAENNETDQEKTDKKNKEKSTSNKKEEGESASDKSTAGKKTPSDKEAEKDDFEKFDPKKHITLSEAKKDKKEIKEGDEIKTELFPPASYGRMAAQTAKQVIIQRLREAERENLYKEFKGKEGEIISGIVQRQERRLILVDLGQTTGIIPPSEQIPGENYRPGMRIKVFVVSVNQTTKGPEIVISRAHPGMVKRLFTMEVPEISSGTVEIMSVSREAGSRSKISVKSNQENIDPVGSCVGQRGSRVQTIISELGGEKIDIVEYSDDPIEYIANALSPAKILKITLNKEEKTTVAEVKEDQLSLAIGKAGQNVRLAARLTGWKIDIVSESKEKVEDKDKEEKFAKGGKEESQENNTDEKKDSEKKENDKEDKDKEENKENTEKKSDKTGEAKKKDQDKEEKESEDKKVESQENNTDEKKDSEKKENDKEDKDKEENKSEESKKKEEK
ncbi:MAG: transcription termination factor NusA [Patescibacteria group bacterium]|nr:transcription termination factor NusA [Patescibacteria group bacterium]